VGYVSVIESDRVYATRHRDGTGTAQGQHGADAYPSGVILLPLVGFAFL
jgi:hypothetical protein